MIKNVYNKIRLVKKSTQPTKKYIENRGTQK